MAFAPSRRLAALRCQLDGGAGSRKSSPVYLMAGANNGRGGPVRLTAPPLERALVVPSEAVRRFRSDGIIVVDGLIHPTAVERLKLQATLIAAETVTRGEIKCTVQSQPRARSSATTAKDLQLRGPLVQLEPALEGRCDNQSHLAVETSLRKMAHMTFHDPLFETHARDPRCLDVIEALLGAGPDIKLYQDQLFMKPAEIGSRQHVHQYQPLGFFIEPADLMVTCWVALDRSTIHNGCFEWQRGLIRAGPCRKSSCRRWKLRPSSALPPTNGRSSWNLAVAPFITGTWRTARSPTSRATDGVGWQRITSRRGVITRARTAASTMRCLSAAAACLGVFEY
jgi:hypothetical protein